MRKKAKELRAAAVARSKGGRSAGGFGGGGFGGGSREAMPVADTSVVEPAPTKPTYTR